MMVNRAIQCMTDGNSVQISSGQIVFKMHKDGSIWQKYPGMSWTKYGNKKDFKAEHREEIFQSAK